MILPRLRTLLCVLRIMASSHEKSSGVYRPVGRLASWLYGLWIGKWTHHCKSDLNRSDILSECRKLRSGVILTLRPETVVRLYGSAVRGMLELRDVLPQGPGTERFAVAPTADGWLPITRLPDRRKRFV